MDRLEEIEGALREAFPHFQDGGQITAEVIKTIGKEYLDMLMGWEPSKDEIDFVDQDGSTRKIVYEPGESPYGPSGGWGIPEDADWEAKQLPADPVTEELGHTTLDPMANAC